jgi:hypothetical protein
MVRFRHYKTHKHLGSAKYLGWSISWGLIRGEWTLDIYWFKHVFVMFRSSQHASPVGKEVW